MHPRLLLASLLSLFVALTLACTGSPLGATPPVPKPVAPAPGDDGRGYDPKPTNVLVIVADDLGTDKVRAYKEHQVTPATPTIDGLAANGVLFRNAYVYPTCSASRAALLTGRYGRRNGMGGIVELGESTHELPLAEVLIPEALEHTGQKWDTAAIGKWHLSGFRTPSAFEHPNLQGFDHFAGCIGNLVLTSEEREQRGNYQHYEKDTDGKVTWSTTYATTETTDDAIASLKSMKSPFFLYVAYNAPHAPLHVPPAELLGRKVGKDATDIDMHTAMVEAMDHEMARLLAAMSPEQRRSTLVVFVGDNGTDRDAILPPRDPSHGKGTLFEGGTNVPLIATGAGVTGRGETAALVHAVDLLPTVLDMVGVNSDDLVIDGVSFARVLEEPGAQGARKYVYTERFAPIGGGPYEVDMAAVRDDRYKLLQAKNGSLRLYDLKDRSDDGEGTAPRDLKGPERGRFEDLKREMERVQRTAKYAY